MIALPHKRANVERLVNYHLRKRENAHLIDANLPPDPGDQVAAFQLQASLAKNAIKEPYLHGILSADYTDKLSTDQWAEIARRYLDHLGYRDQPYATYIHTDRRHIHVHIVSVRVGNDGLLIKDSFDKRRSIEWARQIEIEYGLRRLRTTRSAERKPTLPERQLVAPPRERILEALRTATARTDTLPTLLEDLRTQGVSAHLKVASTGRFQGISFAADGQAFTGSQLGRAYTLGNLSKTHPYHPITDAERLHAFTSPAPETVRTHRLPPVDNTLDAARQHLAAITAERLDFRIYNPQSGALRFRNGLTRDGVEQALPWLLQQAQNGARVLVRPSAPVERRAMFVRTLPTDRLDHLDRLGYRPTLVVQRGATIEVAFLGDHPERAARELARRVARDLDIPQRRQGENWQTLAGTAHDGENARLVRATTATLTDSKPLAEALARFEDRDLLRRAAAPPTTIDTNTRPPLPVLQPVGPEQARLLQDRLVQAYAHVQASPGELTNYHRYLALRTQAETLLGHRTIAPTYPLERLHDHAQLVARISEPGLSTAEMLARRQALRRFEDALPAEARPLTIATTQRLSELAASTARAPLAETAPDLTLLHWRHRALTERFALLAEHAALPVRDRTPVEGRLRDLDGAILSAHRTYLARELDRRLATLEPHDASSIRAAARNIRTIAGIDEALGAARPAPVSRTQLRGALEVYRTSPTPAHREVLLQAAAAYFRHRPTRIPTTTITPHPIRALTRGDDSPAALRTLRQHLRHQFPGIAREARGALPGISLREAAERFARTPSRTHARTLHAAISQRLLPRGAEADVRAVWATFLKVRRVLNRAESWVLSLRRARAAVRELQKDPLAFGADHAVRLAIVIAARYIPLPFVASAATATYSAVKRLIRTPEIDR